MNSGSPQPLARIGAAILEATLRFELGWISSIAREGTGDCANILLLWSGADVGRLPLPWVSRDTRAQGDAMPVTHAKSSLRAASIKPDMVGADPAVAVRCGDVSRDLVAGEMADGATVCSPRARADD
jgi:hypothetical protein